MVIVMVVMCMCMAVALAHCKQPSAHCGFYAAYSMFSFALPTLAMIDASASTFNRDLANVIVDTSTSRSI
jgi:hypothetical protein